MRSLLLDRLDYSRARRKMGRLSETNPSSSPLPISCRKTARTSLAGLHAGVSSGTLHLDWRPIRCSTVVLQQRYIVISFFIGFGSGFFVSPLARSNLLVVLVSLGMMTGDQCSYSQFSYRLLRHSTPAYPTRCGCHKGLLAKQIRIFNHIIQPCGTLRFSFIL